MDILYKGGALLAAQVEGVARLALAVPAAVLYNAAAAAVPSASRSSPPAAAAAAAAAAPSGSRCPFSGLLGSAASCPGARMAAAAAAEAATANPHHPTAETSAAATGGGTDCDRDQSSAAVASGRCWWVEGRVTHVRRRPARHAFAYDVRLALIDLDDPPAWFTASRRASADGGGAYLSAGEARAAAGTAGRVLLLTLPAAAGYAQNPISVYYCYDGVGGMDGQGAVRKKEGEGGTKNREEEDATAGRPQMLPPPQQQQQHQQQQKQQQEPQPQLRRCIAEVTNTPWGERVSFVFDPRGAAVPKSLHVSPFMDMRNVWLLRATDPLSAAGVSGAPAPGAPAGGQEGRPSDGGGGGIGGAHGSNDDGGGNSSRVVLSVLVDHPELGRYFDAQFVGRAVSPVEEGEGGPGGRKASGGGGGGGDGRSERGGLRMLWRYGFLPQRVALWIYVHAVLLALKGVRVQPKPAAGTYAARAEAALEEMACGGGGNKRGQQAAAAAGEGRAPPIPGGPGSGAAWAGRAFVWRPAPSWPWHLD